MTLDPQIRSWLDRMAKQPQPALWEVPVDALRANGVMVREHVERVPVGDVQDVALEGPGGPLPLRLYRPAGRAGKLPLLIYLHGGGFVLGSIATSDPLARRLCVETGAIVATLDYRLAPEHPYPAAVEDASFAVRWCLRQADALGFDTERVIVMGDSAGGNLAGVTTNQLRDGGGRHPLAGQALIYPVTDQRELAYPSRISYGSGYGLSAADMTWFVQQYLPDGVGKDQDTASPILVDDLSGLPPSLVITAEYDPLRSEGEAYAERLREAGVEVTAECIAGANHGVLDNAEGFAVGDVLRAKLVAWARSVFGR